MELPKFLLGDNSDFKEDIFVIHTEFPRFIFNLKNDEITWLEEFEESDLHILEEETESLITQATAFYDKEIEKYSEDA